MPVISLAEVAANRRTIEVDLGLPPAEDGTAQTLTVTYRVNTMTPADELRFSTVQSGDVVPEDRMNDFLAFLIRLVEKWALTVTDGGATVPLETAALKDVPSTILTAVLRSCMTDINDPKALTSTGAR
jgi:hypothetical protein